MTSLRQLEKRILDDLFLPLKDIVDCHHLTEDQKFALALAAGAKIESSSYKDGKLTISTEPCAVVYNEGTYTLITKKRK